MPAVPKPGSSRDKFRLDPPRHREGTPTPTSSNTDEVKPSYKVGMDEYPKPITRNPQTTIESSPKVSGDIGVGDSERVSRSRRNYQHTGSRRGSKHPRPTLKPISNRLGVVDLLGIGDGDGDGEGSSGHNSRQPLGQITPKPGSTLKVRPAFGLTLPFGKLPEFITNGFDLLTALYSTHGAASCIADCIRDLKLVIDLQDPAVELALIMVMLLGSPSPLPRVVDNLDGFQQHTMHGKAKSQWRAVLFIKMMWYRYRDLMTADVKCKFTSYQGQQKITTRFLVKIGWVVIGAQQGSSPNRQTRHDLILIPEEVIRRRLGKYKRLIIEGDSLGLARKIFNGGNAWAKAAVEGFNYHLMRD